MYWYASDLYLKKWGGLSACYPYMHCTRSWKKSDLMHKYARPLCFILGGFLCLWYLYVSICTGISLYFLISWLFQMGSHWQHWTAKSSLSGLAVSSGGYIISFTQVKLTFPYICLWYLYVYICTGISLYILISWPFWLGSYWWHWTAKSSLSALAVLNRGVGVHHQFYLGKSENLS